MVVPQPDVAPKGPDGEDRRVSATPEPAKPSERSGNHTVITPQTAGSAGAAHPSDSPQES